MAKTVKNLPAMQETWVWSLGQEDPLEKGIATHSSILTWRIPWTEKSGGLQSMGWQRARCANANAKSLQSCPTLCDPIDGSPPGSTIPGILQARILEWVAISFSNAWKRKVKVKSLSHVRLLATPWTAAYQAPLSMDFPGKSTGVGCHCLLRARCDLTNNTFFFAGIMVTLKILERKCSLSLFKYESEIIKFDLASYNININIVLFTSLSQVPWTAPQFSRSVVSDSLRPHELQHARPTCPSTTPGVHPNSCP